MSATTAKKHEQLGMPHGTAANRLRKLILFAYVQKAGDDTCHRCGEKIESVDEFSIEHKSAWLDGDIGLFWNLDNIAFSHLSCNISAGRRQAPHMRHGAATTYQRGCRCDDCRAVKAAENARNRNR